MSRPVTILLTAIAISVAQVCAAEYLFHHHYHVFAPDKSYHCQIDTADCNTKGFEVEGPSYSASGNDITFDINHIVKTEDVRCQIHVTVKNGSQYCEFDLHEFAALVSSPKIKDVQCSSGRHLEVAGIIIPNNAQGNDDPGVKPGYNDSKGYYELAVK